MLIELSNFSDKLRQYRLILEKLTANQPDYERRREKLRSDRKRQRHLTNSSSTVGMLPVDRFLGSPWLPGSTMKLTPGVGMTLLIGIAGSIFLVTQSHRLLRSFVVFCIDVKLQQLQ
uniref:Uncharacterized protein n=1 Tax=Anopheles christyi TaxID=43041 RepID=A0A182K8Y4_9DIPT